MHLLPFRGEYFRLRESRHHLVRGLIYPVPDPRFPFLGVHLTRRVNGAVEAGPSAVPALAREGYRRTSFSMRDVAEATAFGGAWRMARRHWRFGLAELARSLSRRAFARAARALVPEIEEDDLERAPAGVRAQALSRSGDLLDDFALAEGPGALHVLNAPSPAATASSRDCARGCGSRFPLARLGRLKPLSASL